MELRERNHLLISLKCPGEAVRADVEASASCPDLDNIIDEDGYSEQKTYNIDETILCSKKMLLKTFIVTEEKAVSDFNISKDRLVSDEELMQLVILLKPVLIYHFENPRTLRIVLNPCCLSSIYGQHSLSECISEHGLLSILTDY